MQASNGPFSKMNITKRRDECRLANSLSAHIIPRDHKGKPTSFQNSSLCSSDTLRFHSSLYCSIDWMRARSATSLNGA